MEDFKWSAFEDSKETIIELYIKLLLEYVLWKQLSSWYPAW